MKMYSKEEMRIAVFAGVKKTSKFDSEQDYINFCLDIINNITKELNDNE